MINLEKDVKLKVLKKEYITIDYIEWMNDYEVTRFTEQRFNKHTSNSVSEFIMEKSRSKTDKLLGIFVYKKHIGNILISSIDKNNSSYFYLDQEMKIQNHTYHNNKYLTSQNNQHHSQREIYIHQLAA